MLHIVAWRTLWEHIWYNSTKVLRSLFHHASHRINLLFCLLFWPAHKYINPHIIHANALRHFFMGCGGFKAYAQILWYFFNQEVESNSPPLHYKLDLVTHFYLIEVSKNDAARPLRMSKGDVASAWLWLSIETYPFGTVIHPVIKLATLKPPCWREQMEKTHRDRVMSVEPQCFRFPGIEVLDHFNMGMRKLLRWLRPQTPSDYNYSRNLLKY